MGKKGEAYTADIRMQYHYDPVAQQWTRANEQLSEEKLWRMTKADLIKLYNKMYEALERAENEVAVGLNRAEQHKEEIEGQSKIIAAMVNMALLIPHGKG